MLTIKDLVLSDGTNSVTLTQEQADLFTQALIRDEQPAWQQDKHLYSPVQGVGVWLTKDGERQVWFMGQNYPVTEDLQLASAKFRVGDEVISEESFYFSYSANYILAGSIGTITRVYLGPIANILFEVKFEGGVVDDASPHQLSAAPPSQTWRARQIGSARLVRDSVVQARTEAEARALAGVLPWPEADTVLSNIEVVPTDDIEAVDLTDLGAAIRAALSGDPATRIALLNAYPA